jgi:hypothetical protein
MQELILQQSLLVSIGALLFGLLFGLFLGRRSERSKVEGRINEAYEKAQEQAQVEKINLASELHVELDKVRESIIKSAEAYQGAVNSIDSKLSSKDIPSNKPAIDISVRAHLDAPTEIEKEGLDSQVQTKESKVDTSSAQEDESEENSESVTLRLDTEGLEEALDDKPADESDTLEQKAISDTEELKEKKRA